MPDAHAADRPMAAGGGQFRLRRRRRHVHRPLSEALVDQPFGSSPREEAASCYEVTLAQRDPADVARPMTAVAVSRLIERIGQLPLLRFVAPLHGRTGYDVIGVALRADRR